MNPSGSALKGGGGGEQLVALEQIPLEDELEGYFGVRCSFTRRETQFWVGTGSARRTWIKELARVIKHAEEVHAHKKEQLAMLERQRSFEDQKSKVAKSKEEVEQQKREVEAKKKDMELRFEVKELLDDLVSRVEERIADEMPTKPSSDGYVRSPRPFCWSVVSFRHFSPHFLLSLHAKKTFARTLCSKPAFLIAPLNF